MAELRKRLKKGLAGFLALCMTITSFTGISWSDEEVSYDVSIKLEGLEIWEAAQEAITNGTQIPLKEKLDEDDTATAEFYGLFKKTDNKGSVFEMTLDYEYETGEDGEVPDGADFSAYVRTKKYLTDEEAETYKLTGDEQIIFLFYNESDAVLKYQLHIDEQLTTKVRVSKYEERLETVIPETEESPDLTGSENTDGQVTEPDNDLAPSTEAEEETTPVPEESTSAAIPETETQAPEETSFQEEIIETPAETTAPIAPEETLPPSQEESQEQVEETEIQGEIIAVETEETLAPALEETENEEPTEAPLEDDNKEVSEEIEHQVEEPEPVVEDSEISADEGVIAISRNHTFTLMSANTNEAEVSTKSQIISIASPSNGKKIVFSRFC